MSRGGHSRASESAPEVGRPADNASADRRSRRLAVFAIMAATVLALDIISKAVAVSRLGDHPPVELLGGALTLRLVHNSGAAFGIGGSFTVAFTLISIVVAAVIIRVALRVRCRSWAITLGLLLGGALGNLTDRLLRPPGPFRGRVVDWIELPHWPVFNLADTAIVCGGILVVVLAARGRQLNGTRARES